MVIGRHAVVGSMRYGVRWTEELLIKALFHLPSRAGQRRAALRWLGGAARATTRSREATSTICVPTSWCSGFSERTSPAALDELCDTVFEQGQVTDVLVVVMPKAPTRHPSRHDLHPGGPRLVCGLSRRFSWAPSGCPCCTGGRASDGVREMPELLRRAPRGRACRWSRSSPAASIAPARSGSSGARPATSSRCGPAPS